MKISSNSHENLIKFPWKSHQIPMKISSNSHENLIKFPWKSHQILMKIFWVGSFEPPLPGPLLRQPPSRREGSHTLGAAGADAWAANGAAVAWNMNHEIWHSMGYIYIYDILYNGSLLWDIMIIMIQFSERERGSNMKWTSVFSIKEPNGDGRPWRMKNGDSKMSWIDQVKWLATKIVDFAGKTRGWTGAPRRIVQGLQEIYWCRVWVLPSKNDGFNRQDWDVADVPSGELT